MQERNIPIEEEPMDINSDADIPGNTHLSNPDSDTEDADSETEKLKAEVQEQKDKYLRLFAEFDNFKTQDCQRAHRAYTNCRERHGHWPPGSGG
jgi:molecular chaperone GrpE (heat shock protein)